MTEEKEKVIEEQTNDNQSEASTDSPQIDEQDDDMFPELPVFKPPVKREKVTVSWQVEEFGSITESVYEAIMIASHRARQIGRKQKKDIDNWASAVEVIESEGQLDEASEPGVDHFNHTKPTIQAFSELENGKLTYHYQEDSD